MSFSILCKLSSATKERLCNTVKWGSLGLVAGWMVGTIGGGIAVGSMCGGKSSQIVGNATISDADQCDRDQYNHFSPTASYEGVGDIRNMFANYSSLGAAFVGMIVGAVYGWNKPIERRNDEMTQLRDSVDGKHKRSQSSSKALNEGASSSYSSMSPSAHAAAAAAAAASVKSPTIRAATPPA